MNYLIVPWHLFLANKQIFLNEIALANSLNCNDTLLKKKNPIHIHGISVDIFMDIHGYILNICVYKNF